MRHHRHGNPAALCLLVIAVAALGVSCTRDARPNVLLIVLDTLRADRLGCYGYNRDTSPNIDALAAQGVLFERAYAPCCWTLPSHAALMTGLHPVQIGATSETLHLPDSTTTLAEALTGEGYRTAGFVCNSWVSQERGFARGFGEYYEMWRAANQPGVKRVHETLESVTVDRMIAWLRASHTGNAPFFAFANLNGVHLPYQPREPFLSRFAGGKDYAVDRVERVGRLTSWWSHLTGETKLDDTDYQILSDLYDGEVGSADAQVGRLVQCLEELGELENTIVVVTSDHGENLGEKDRIDHMMTMYETVLHIPLVIRYPGAFAGGRREGDLVSLIDVAPTVTSLCRAGGMAHLRPDITSLAGAHREPRPFVIAGNERPLTGIELLKSRYPGYDWESIDYRMRALRTDTHKLIWNTGRGAELYDLRQDPSEERNLAETHANTQRQLMQVLRGQFEAIASTKTRGRFESTDEESLERLRALGYIN